MFEIERVRDRERKIRYSLHTGTETLVRDREKFEIEGVRDRESQLCILMDFGKQEYCGTQKCCILKDGIRQSYTLTDTDIA